MFDLPRLREIDSGIDDESNNTSSNNTTIHANSSMSDINRIITEETYRKDLSRDRNRNTEYDGGGIGTPTHYRKMRKAFSSNDLKSLSLSSGRPSSFYRSVSFIPDYIEHIPPPSSKTEKLKMTGRYFATVIGLCYAIFLVVFGGIAVVGDAIQDISPLPEILILYMVSVSLIYIIFLYVDIRIHVSRAKSALAEREKRLKLFEQTLAKASLSLEADLNGTDLNESTTDDKISISYVDLPPLKPVSHRYCFVTGRHGEFFYLKLGAAWFAIGLMIDSTLQIAYQIIYLTSEELRGYNCASGLSLTNDILFPIYSIFVLFFIYKYVNIIINERKELARLMLMHTIGTSLTYWIYTIVRETTDAIALSEDVNGKFLDQWLDARDGNNTNHEKCMEDGGLNYVQKTFTPYLYPFVIEFSILIVGIWYIIWSHINSCPKRMISVSHDTESVLPGQDPKTNPEKNSNYAESEHDNEVNTNTFIYADCHATHRGLFAGMFLIVATVVFVILFFVAVNNESYLDAGIIINTVFELVVLIIMILAVLFAYFQTSKLDINAHPVSKLDDILLFIAVPAFFMETILSLAPAIFYQSPLHICIAAAQIVQVLLQTPFIIDGLRRCANARSLRKNKPGRELVMFITIANVSLWIYYTFSIKGGYRGDFRYKFYGYTAWNILNHISQPLIMFYRFHASVCLVDIWRHSYEPAPSGHH